MDAFSFNPYIRLATESILTKGCYIARRALFDYELIYVEKGSFRLSYAEKEYEPKAGDFLLLRPAVAHSFDCYSGDVSQPHVHFDMVYTSHSEENPISYKDLPEMSVAERGRVAEDIFCDAPLIPFVTFKEPERAVWLLKKVIAAFRANALLEGKAYMTLLLSLLFENNFKDVFEKRTLDKTELLCREIKALIDGGSGFSLSLSEIAARFSYHPTYLEKLFRDGYGVGIIAYKNARRMQEAKRLLSSESVTAVSHHLGFSSVYAFSRAFKNHFGFSPRSCSKK